MPTIRTLFMKHFSCPMLLFITGSPHPTFAQADRLHQQLKTHYNIHLVYDYMPDERHSTVMHQAAYNAFKKLYPKTAY